MSFFKNFPLIEYQINDSPQQFVIARNILASVKLKDILLDPSKSSNLYVDYLVQDGEKPEHIAHRVYGSADLHWIILLSNQIINPYFDWPLSDLELTAYIQNKYPGLALFFDPTNIKFNIKNSSTLLSQQKSQFIVENIVSQNSVTGTINSWDNTLRKLVVTDTNLVDLDFSFQKNINCVSLNYDNIYFETPIKRIVFENADSVHHFIDDFDNILDPYGKINFGQYSDGKIYSTSNILLNKDITITSTNNYILNLYINESKEENVVTNKQYEIENNLKKANIKILRVDYVDTLIQQLNTAFK